MPWRIFPTWSDADGPMSKPLLVPHLLLPLWIGLGYILGDPERTATPTFFQARDLAPMWAWGVMFLFGATAIGITMWLRDSYWLRLALFVGGVIFTWWGMLFLIAVFRTESASLNGGALYMFIAYIYFLTAAAPRRSLPR